MVILVTIYNITFKFPIEVLILWFFFFFFSCAVKACQTYYMVKLVVYMCQDWFALQNDVWRWYPKCLMDFIKSGMHLVSKWTGCNIKITVCLYDLNFMDYLFEWVSQCESVFVRLSPTMERWGKKGGKLIFIVENWRFGSN